MFTCDKKGFFLIESILLLQVVGVLSLLLCTTLILFQKEKQREVVVDDEIEWMQSAYES